MGIQFRQAVVVMHDNLRFEHSTCGMPADRCEFRVCKHFKCGPLLYHSAAIHHHNRGGKSRNFCRRVAHIKHRHIQLITQPLKIRHDLGFALIAASCLGVVLCDRTTGNGFLLTVMLAGGFGLGLVLPNLTVFAQQAAAREHLGIATALLQSLRMIGGMLASNIGAGFIGGILAGFLAGYVAKAVTRYVRLPSSVESLKPILIIPLLASLVTGLLMIYVVGTPVAGVLQSLTRFLDSMGSTNAILLGALLGGMMCVDLGGPINKAAYAFSVGLLASSSYAPMAATMAGGMASMTGFLINPRFPARLKSGLR